MAYQVGSAFVPVEPDLRGFHRKIRDAFKAMQPEADKAGHTVGKKFASSFQDELRAKFAKLPHAKIQADADTKKAKEEIDQAARERTAKVKADADTRKAREKLDRVARTRTAEVKVKFTNPLKGVSPLLGAGVLGGLAYGPQAAGAAAGVAGLAAGLGAAGVAAGAFGAIAVPMFTKVSAAQKKLTAARLQYDKATTKAQRATALNNEKHALDGLTPSERKLATQLTGLKQAWADLGKAEQPVVTRSLSPWFSVAQRGMGFLRPLVSDAGSAFRVLGNDAKNALDKPFWGKFFRTTGGVGKVALIGFGRALGHVGDGLAHLFVTFAPDLKKLPPLIDRWAGSFDHWAKSVNRSGFDRFMTKTFSPQNAANMKSSLKAAGTLLGNVAKATVNISPSAMGGLNNVLVALSKLSPQQIEALGILYTASRFTGSISGLGSLFGKGAAGKAAAGGSAAEKLAGAGLAGALAKYGIKYTKLGAGLAGLFIVGVNTKLPAVHKTLWQLGDPPPPGQRQTWYNSWSGFGHGIVSVFTGSFLKSPSAHSAVAQFSGDLLHTGRPAINAFRGAMESAATTIERQFRPQLAKLHANTPAVRQDMDRLASSIQATGTKSAQSRSARQEMIRDLERSGVKANVARGLVNDYIKRLQAIPGHVSTQIKAFGSGSGRITFKDQIAGQNAQGFLEFHRAGGKIPGYGGGDKHPSLLESGEAVVDKVRTRKYAGVLRAMGVPGMASGGLVGGPHSPLAAAVPYEARRERSFYQGVIGQAFTAAKDEFRRLARSLGGPAHGNLGVAERAWTGAGGPGGIIAHIAGAITGAESGFNARAVQQGQPYATTGWGPWQITPGNSEPQFGVDRALLNWHTNAQAAVAKYRGAGSTFLPWTTFTDGAYLNFMDSGGTLAPGLNHVWNGLGRPEQLVRPEQVVAAVRGAAARGGDGVAVTVLLDGRAIEPRMVKVVTEHERQVTRRAGAGTGQVR